MEFGNLGFRGVVSAAMVEDQYQFDPEVVAAMVDQARRGFVSQNSEEVLGSGTTWEALPEKAGLSKDRQ